MSEFGDVKMNAFPYLGLGRPHESGREMARGWVRAEVIPTAVFWLARLGARGGWPWEAAS